MDLRHRAQRPADVDPPWRDRTTRHERLGLQERLDRPERAEEPVPGTTWADGADELLDSLPPQQREAVRLRVLEDLEYSDIARELGTTPGAARVRVHRGLKALKDHLTPSQEDPS